MKYTLIKIGRKFGYYEIKNGVRNLVRWLPVIWNDRDYNELHLFRMMEKKLKHMEEFHINCGDFDIAEEIEVAKQALERLSADQYHILASRHYGVKPFADMTKEDEGTVAKINTLQIKMRNHDLQRVFSKRVARQVDRWWN